MRLTLFTLLALCAASLGSSPAFGAAKDAPKTTKPAPAPEDPDLASAGKVIEIDGSGNAKVVKGNPGDPAEPQPTPAKVEPAKDEKLKAGEISNAEACKLRFSAQCNTLKRCMPKGTELPMPCDELISGCEGAAGKAPYARKAVEACAKGVTALKCEAAKIDWNNPATLNPEARVPACKPLLDADQAELQKAGPPGSGAGGAGGDMPKDIDIGRALQGE